MHFLDVDFPQRTFCFWVCGTDVKNRTSMHLWRSHFKNLIIFTKEEVWYLPCIHYIPQTYLHDNQALFSLKLILFGFLAITCVNKESDTVKFLVHLHSLICDLPGKAMALLHKLFNGKFGCTVTCFLCSYWFYLFFIYLPHNKFQICFHPGKRLQIAGNVRVYPYAADVYELRTAEATKKHAILAQQCGTDVSI